MTELVVKQKQKRKKILTLTEPLFQSNILLKTSSIRDVTDDRTPNADKPKPKKQRTLEASVAMSSDEEYAAPYKQAFLTVFHDCWTNAAMVSIIGVTIIFIDIKRRIRVFSLLALPNPGSHTATTVAQRIGSVLRLMVDDGASVITSSSVKITQSSEWIDMVQSFGHAIYPQGFDLLSTHHLICTHGTSVFGSRLGSCSGKYIGPYSNQVILPRTRVSRRSLQLDRSIVSALAPNSPAIGSGQASQKKELGTPHKHPKSIKIDNLPGA
ncbi:hypothetical protein F441_12016 [Phytophthora nicotianae CJ01A1]|uniref:Uncharacterized protein n=2 Tax=Phytophthora nicotianae TaxID=4792 RepID=W2WSX4_PHYNI|nr:hypothetical protein F441_12016 [Phytophthora nicotianae CJ01A1]